MELVGSYHEFQLTWLSYPGIPCCAHESISSVTVSMLSMNVINANEVLDGCSTPFSVQQHYISINIVLHDIDSDLPGCSNQAKLIMEYSQLDIIWLIVQNLVAQRFNRRADTTYFTCSVP